MLSSIACVVALAAPAVAEAHGGSALAPHDTLRAWTLDPTTLLLIATSAFLYGRGVARVWHRAGRGRGVSYPQVGAFAGGLLTIAVALISPLDALAAELLSAHMAQHLLLLAVGAPLIVLGAPAVALSWGVRTEARLVFRDIRRNRGIIMLGHALTTPPVAWLIFAATIWVWHAPRLYDAALGDAMIHALEHASFLASSMLFWWVLVQHAGRRRLEFGAAAAFVFLSMLQMSVLAALMTLSDRTWYQAYDGGAPDWGLTQLQDQRLAGLLMWIPSNGVFLVAMLAIVARWLTRDARNAPLSAWQPRGPLPDRLEQRP